jgi:hypothetical protein
MKVREFLLPFCSETFVSHLLPKDLKIAIYNSIILAVLLYGSETWFLMRREEHRLRVFENREMQMALK